VALRSRDRKVAYGSGRDRFKGRWCGRGTEAPPLEYDGAGYPYEQQRESRDNQFVSSFHVSSPRLLMTFCFVQ
jgi:hypothetical protein